MRCTMTKLYSYIVLFILCACVSNAGAVMVLSQQSGTYDLVSYSEYSLDDTKKSDDTFPQKTIETLQFSPIQRAKIDFGFRRQPIWIKTEIVNDSDTKQSWVLNLNTRFMNGLNVYIDRGGRIELLLKNGESSSFDARPLPQVKLALPVELAGREAVILYIRYWSRGTTALPAVIQTKETYATVLHEESLKYMGFYSIVGLLIVFALFQFLFVNNKLQIIYILYVGSVSLYVLHMDGLSFKYLWPDFPEWNAFSSLPLGLLMTVLGMHFSRVFLDTRNNLPRLDMFLRLVFPIAFFLLVYGAFFDSELSRKLSMILNLYVVFSGLFSGILSLAGGMKSARFYVIGWVSLCFASAWTNISHFLPFSLPVATSFDMIRLGIVADALMFQLALSDQANEVAVQRDTLVRSEKAALKKQQVAERSVYKAEQELLEAMAFAKQKTRELETTSHDLKQPLASMRLALAQMKNQKEMNSTVVGRFEKSVDFLEFLAEHPGEAPSDLTTINSESLWGNPVVFPANKIISSIDAMFREEAEEKELQFRCKPSRLSICGIPNDILRIVSNLVSNSIRYTDKGKILVGCKRRGDCLTIVVADTGPGISPAEQSTILEYGKRGKMHTIDGQGDGLGLSIAYQLADKNGYYIQIKSQPGSGTVVTVEVPLELS